MVYQRRFWLAFPLIAMATAVAYEEPSAVTGDAPEIAQEHRAPLSAPDTLELPASVVEANVPRLHHETELSRTTLGRDDLRKIAATQGDPLKAVTTLPGVAHLNDLSVRPFVRGGQSQETQVLWAGISLIQPYHFGSFYSIFNHESIDRMDVYSGGFPVQAGDALSGVLLLTPRPPPLDSFRLFADVSMLRGSIHAGKPIVPGRLGISVSYQSFWYDHIMTRGWDAVTLMTNGASFTKKNFMNYVDLPNFHDLQVDLLFAINESMRIYSTTLYSHDIFTLRQQRNRFFVEGKEVSTEYYGWASANRPEAKLRSETHYVPKTLVAVDNLVQNVRLDWDLSPQWQLQPSLAYQSQAWDVEFRDDLLVWSDPYAISPTGEFEGYRIRDPSDRVFRLNRKAYDWQINLTRKSESHQFLVGASQSFRPSRYMLLLERSYYESIVNGNMNDREDLAAYDPDGFIIEGIDYQTGNLVSGLPDLIRFDDSGRTAGTQSALYIYDSWDLARGKRLLLGVRGDYDSYSRHASISPRATYFHSLGHKDEITVATGLYSRSDYPFHMRAANPTLAPEKSGHFNTEWSHAFTPHYRMEWRGYYKHYFDLAAPFLENTGKPNIHLAAIDSAGYEALSEAQQDSIIDLFGYRHVGYRNSGSGYATGLEAVFFYDPSPSWSGWFSGEVSRSMRRDAPGERFYNFQYHRPWIVNWVNHFRMPSQYELSLRLRWAAGLPYTAYKEGSDLGMESDTLIWVGPRNAERYAAYRRFDIRLSKEILWGSHRLQSYIEIWNILNDPNFIMRDASSGEWDYFDLNFPIPVLFVGLSYRW